MILCDNGPAVRQQLHIRFAGVDHRLDGERHSLDEFEASAAFAVVEHLWIFVKHFTNAMPAVFAHHGKAVFFHVLLDGSADIAKMLAGPSSSIPSHMLWKGDIGETFRLNVGFADKKTSGWCRRGSGP